MPPDAEQIMIFISQVFLTPLYWIFSFIGALAITIYLIFRFKELLNR